jgi:predicted PurR-regulated permease PerM
MPGQSGLSSGDARPEVTREGRWLRTDVILLLIALGVLVWLTAEVLFLVFAAILLAIGLDGLACGTARHTPLSRGWALLVVLVVIVLMVALLGMLVVPQVLEQFDQMWGQLTDFLERQADQLKEYGWVQQLLGGGQNPDAAAEAAEGVAEQVAGVALALAGAAASFVILIAITIFAAANPDLYRRGLIKLLPAEFRSRVDDTLSVTAYALRWWFLGQLVSMLLLGVTVSLGLLLIGIELWLALGLLTALLTFIPFLGPLIAGVPIVIVGFAEGVQVGLIVLAFYLLVQNIEGNFIVPLIHQRAVHLPPALLIGVQVLFGVLFGAIGLILAAPLTVVGMVAVKKLWVEDTLGEEKTPL